MQIIRARCTVVDIRLILCLRELKDSQRKYWLVKVGPTAKLHFQCSWFYELFTNGMWFADFGFSNDMRPIIWQHCVGVGPNCAKIKNYKLFCKYSAFA